MNRNCWNIGLKINQNKNIKKRLTLKYKKIMLLYESNNNDTIRENNSK